MQTFSRFNNNVIICYSLSQPTERGGINIFESLILFGFGTNKTIIFPSISATPMKSARLIDIKTNRPLEVSDYTGRLLRKAHLEKFSIPRCALRFSVVQKFSSIFDEIFENLIHQATFVYLNRKVASSTDQDGESLRNWCQQSLCVVPRFGQRGWRHH